MCTFRMLFHIIYWSSSTWKELDVKSSETIEEVFGMDGFSVEQGHTRLSYKLNRFYLIHLPWLKTVWRVIQES